MKDGAAAVPAVAVEAAAKFPSSLPEQQSRAPKRPRKAKITPLPLSQLIPMTFVIVNESICGTMLMPFIGPLVAYLRGVPVDEAGYYSGIMVGMFMVGQVLSAKAWGRISDKYGRRFPIISGLFTSGLTMLGFGLCTNIWLLAMFRFLQGLFNGNILVAKTMMADITDKTNQGGGFSFMSICNAFGFLIGPALGGLLYDPAHSDALSWAGFDAHGFFSTHPAFLPSLIIFVYTNIGMLVCTFLVKESNPHAQPLPGFMRLVYPCFWYKAEQFVLPPLQYETEEEDDEKNEEDGGDATTRSRDANLGRETANSVPDGVNPNHKGSHDSSNITPSSPGELPGAALAPFSPVDSEDVRRFDHVLVEELVVLPVSSSQRSRSANASVVGATVDAAAIPSSRRARERESSVTRHSHQSSSAATPKKLHDDDDGDESDHQRHAVEAAARMNIRRDKAQQQSKEQGIMEIDVLSTRRPSSAASSNNDLDTPVTAAATAAAPQTQEPRVTKFGYRQAFARPYTRFMLSQYMLLCATDMAVRECFPLWAVATVAAGGLGMTINQVSYILLANSLPCFAANVLFRLFERKYTNKMGLFRIGMLGAGTAVLLVPFNYYVGSTVWVYILVFLCTSARQIFASWCYSLNTMLTARSAPPGHVGSIMGINQSCNALVRGIVPFVAAPIFAWSISGTHFFPFNHVLIFFISAAAFYYGWWRSYSIRTDMDGNLQMVT